jgi:ferredoxin
VVDREARRGGRDEPESQELLLRYGDNVIPARRGTRLLDLILEAGIDHRHICGGRGFCTSCRVEVVEGASSLSPVSGLERERLGSEAGTLRLACQTYVYCHAAVRVPKPKSSRFSPFDPE